MLVDTLITIGIFIGFYFLVVRPLQKKHGVNTELKLRSRIKAHHNDPTYNFLAGNTFYRDHHKDS